MDTILMVEREIQRAKSYTAKKELRLGLPEEVPGSDG